MAGEFAFCFIMLTLTHFLADWMFQDRYTALGKFNSRRIRAYHSAHYSLYLSLGAVIGGAPWIYLLMIFPWFLMTHFLLDDRKLVSWWIRCVKKEHESSDMYRTFSIMTDQVFHVLCFIPVIVWIVIG